MTAKNLLYHSKIIRYYEEGEGEPLFLLHGYQADSRIWDKIVPLLKDKYKLIIPDLPGHGESDGIRSVNTMEFFAEVVYILMLTLGLKGASFAGHSMGGYVALAFAEKYPESVDQLILINSHPFEDSMTRILARNREAELIENGKKHLLLISFSSNNFFVDNCDNLKDEIKFATRIALDQPEKGMIADLAGMMARPDRLDVLKKARFPIRVIYSENDSKIPQQLIDKINKNNIKTISLKECGHLSLLEKPIELAGIIHGTI